MPGQADVVAEDAEPVPVADECPEVLIGAIEQLLHEPVWAGQDNARITRHAAVEIGAASDEVDRGVLPGVGDRVALAVDLDRPGGCEATVTEFLPEREEPAVAGDSGAGVAGRQALDRALKRGPRPQQPVPGAVGGLVELFALDQVIRCRRQAVQGRIPGRDAGADRREGSPLRCGRS